MTNEEERDLNAIAVSMLNKQLISLNDEEMALVLRERDTERYLREYISEHVIGGNPPALPAAVQDLIRAMLGPDGFASTTRPVWESTEKVSHDTSGSTPARE